MVKKSTKTGSKAKKSVRKAKPRLKKTTKEPSPTVLLRKVITVSDSAKNLSKEIKSMTKIFAENQKVLPTPRRSSTT